VTLPSSNTLVPVSPESLARAASLLQRDEVCAFPTETVYGLGGNALSPAAIERIYALKGRPKYNPLIVHVDDAQAAAQLAGGWPAVAQRLADRFWPGPLTLVVPRGAAVPALVSAGRPTMALRVPAHPVALALLRIARLPLAAPSANRSESVSPTTATHVLRSLPAVPLILDGGPCPLGIESTVVDLTTAPPRLLRSGALPLRALLALLPDLELPAATQSLGVESAESAHSVHAVDQAPRAAPGMLSRHYAPRAPLWLLGSAQTELTPAQLAALPPPRGLWTYTPLPELAAHFHQVEQLASSPQAFAADLYAALHRLDDSGVASIAALTPPPDLDWHAITDRLQRAAFR
jgi:L-threonylcarbamoyladenylate synthase